MSREQPTAAERACIYLLDRLQTDPDLGYYISWGTESFHLLCVAEAEFTGRPVEEVERERMRDLQPKYRKREPEVVVLRRRVEGFLNDSAVNSGRG